MYRNFGYKGYNQEPTDNVGTINGVVEIEEQHQWRLDNTYPVSFGISGFELKQSTNPLSSSHNLNSDGTIPFMQNEEYVIHLREDSILTSGTTTRYWTIDSSTYDYMFQDQTGSITIDHATGAGTATFRTRFIHWFTTGETFNLRIRSGSTTGPIMASFQLKVLLPTVVIQYFDKDGVISSSQQALIENQLDEKYTDFRLNIINIGENASAGFSGKVKLQVSSVTFNTASADDVEFPDMPYDKENGVVSNEAQVFPGVVEKTSFDFDGFNINTDATLEGTETFSVAINVYKDPVVGGLEAMPPIQMQILDTNSTAPSFTLTLRTGSSPSPYNRYSANEIQTGLYTTFYGGLMSNYSGTVSSVYDDIVPEDGKIGFDVSTTTQNAGGRYYFEIEPVTTSVSGFATVPYNANPSQYPTATQYSGNVAPYLTPGQDVFPASGHFTIDDTGAYLGNPDHDNNASLPSEWRNKERLDFNISGDTFPQFASSTNPGELHEGFVVKIYPENKTPPTLLGSSVAVMVHSGNSDTGNALSTEMTEVTGGPSFISLNIQQTQIDGSGAYNAPDSTEPFNVRDFYVGPALDGQTKRIYIAAKFSPGTYGQDLAIGGLQILDLTQANPVIKAMPISSTHANRRWVISGTDPLTYSSTSDGYFETSEYAFQASNTSQELLASNSLSTVANLPYTSMNNFTLPSTPNFVNGRWNVTGFNNFGTPSLATGMAGGIDPATWNQAPYVRPLNPAVIFPNKAEPQVAASSTVGHYYMESSIAVYSNGNAPASSDYASVVFRSPKHTFSQGEVIRLCFAAALAPTYAYRDTDYFFIGVT